MFSLKLPIFGTLKKKMLTSLFSETLALLNTSGVPILRSMEIVKESLIIQWRLLKYSMQ